MRPTLPAYLARLRATFARRERLMMGVVLLLGLLVRVPFLARDFRVTNDVETYRHWARTIHAQGLTEIYATARADYPPVLLYALGGAAWIEAGLTRRGALPASSGLLNVLIKLPSIMADVLTAGLIAWTFGRGQRGRRVLACAAYAFNPAIWYVSAVWGQTDSIYTLFLVACVTSLARAAVMPAWLAYTLALGTKLQSIALAPLLVAWSLARHGARGLLSGLTVAGVVGTILIVPWLFAGRGADLLRAYTALPAESPRVVVSAYNLWYLLFLGRVHALSSVPHPANLPLSYQDIGIALFAAFAGLVSGLALWRSRGVAVTAAALSLGMFMLLTQMHERYMFPVLALLLLGVSERAPASPSVDSGGRPSGVQRRSWMYCTLSATFLFNLVTVASFNPAWWINLVAAPADTPLIIVLKGLSLAAALINTLVLAWLVVEMASDR